MRKILETTSLFILIAVVALRPLVAESYDSAGSALTEALGAVSDPRPLHTLLIDVLIILGCCGWAVSRAVAREAYRKTGLEWGFLLVGVSAAASCFVAGNKRLAVNATIDWLCSPLLAIALVQLLRTAAHRRILLAAILASSAAQSAQCIEQAWIGFGETWDHYYSIREDFWARQGVALDSSKVEQFEHRLQAREATGFLQHSNVTGSYLVLCGLAALGVCVDRWRRKKAMAGEALSAIGCTVIALATAVALALTKSRGAIVAGVAALGWFLIAPLTRSRSVPHRRAWVLSDWGFAALATLAVIGYGRSQGSLPGSSLLFRWQYWTAAATMFLHHPLTGVGRENFGRHYTQFKSIESPEEVANPHNLFVQAACDWGIVGLLGMVIMLVGWTLQAVTVTHDVSVEQPKARPTFWPTWAIALGLVVTIGRVPFLGSTDVSFVYYVTVMTGLAWLAGFAFVSSASRDGAHGARTAVVAGALAFLIHDLINFALFVPATATTFFAAIAYTAAGDRAVAKPPASSGLLRWTPAAAGAAALLVVLIVAVVPVARAERHLREARNASSVLVPGPLAAQPAFAQFSAAAEADVLDPTPLVAQAEWLFAAAQAVPDQRIAAQRAAVETVSAAMLRDPYNIRLPRLRSRIHLSSAASSANREDYLAAIDDAKRALSLYPPSPADWVALADAQAAAGEALSLDDLLHEAVLNYTHALNLDDQRLAWETLRRLRPSEKAAIQAKLDRIGQMLDQ